MHRDPIGGDGRREIRDPRPIRLPAPRACVTTVTMFVVHVAPSGLLIYDPIRGTMRTCRQSEKRSRALSPGLFGITAALKKHLAIVRDLAAALRARAAARPHGASLVASR